MKTFAMLLMIAVFAAVPGALQAQEMDVPATIQIPLLYKILTFDRKLGNRTPDDVIVIAVVFQTGYRASALARDQVVDALKGMKDSTISDHPVRWVLLELDDLDAFNRALTRERVDVIYVTPLRGVELDGIITAARSKAVTTFTGVPRYVERGLGLGVGVNRERAQIIVNLTATRAEGSDFNSQLLRVSKVIEE
ncbi:MAG TPA: YfiR family protein [Gemmatimonadales bacterium]|jgi:hypothetical protein|nr:YfiR family protein [Gemmatimonadales bacterium]